MYLAGTQIKELTDENERDLLSANRAGSPRNTSVANAVIGPTLQDGVIPAAVLPDVCKLALRLAGLAFSISASNFAYIACSSLRR